MTAAIDPLAGLAPATPAAVKLARLAAGHSQARAAALVGLGHVMRWSDIERGVHKIDAARWALYLLATGQHPTLRLAPRRRGKAQTLASSPTVEKPAPPPP